ncbi:MAG: SpoIIE family protein phosphatase [Clostridia bacterium]|nr:SpoIIE family protein phosphatase [Clostridia bacterium]
MARNEKGWVSLTVKLNVLILAITILLAGGLTVIAYQVNSERVDRYYKQTTSEAASAIAAFMDGDYVARLKASIATEEFEKVRNDAEQSENEYIIQQWLVDQDLYDSFQKISEDLVLYRQKLDAKYIYLQSLEGNVSVNLIDPDEDLLYVGSIEISPEEFEAYQGNVHIEPTVSTTEEYGWLCSAYEPVVDSQGNAVAILGVDIDMNDVMDERQVFLIDMLLFAGVLMIVAVGVSIILMRKMATKPLAMLSQATMGFVDGEKGYTKDDVICLPIRSKDEIGDLYREIRTMEGRMVEYLDNLTRVTAEKERIGAELNIATQIQADMLPRIFPAFPERHEFDLFATMDPAKEVGGDFYDFFLVDDDHICLVMADVSGKGVPAALFMVIAKTLIKNRAQMGDSPAEILTNVNEQLCQGNDAELFVTVWLAVIELSTGHGVAANAGHEHPVIKRKDGQYELVVYRHSPAVATMDGIRFREHTFELNPGDRLFVYTDGVPEATNARNELFGTDRMLAALNRDPDAAPHELLRTMSNDIDAFVGGAPQFDDITMLSFQYAGSEGKKLNELTLEAKVENLDEVLAFVDGQLEQLNCPLKTQMQIDVAVEELYVNIAHYAYTPNVGIATIRVDTLPDPLAVAITFIDRGIPYDPLKKPDPDVTLPAEDRQIGGLGIYMVKKSMDTIDYEYRDGQNILRIVKNIG